MPAVVSIMVGKHFEEVEKEMKRELQNVFPLVPPNAKNHKRFSIPEQLIDKDGMVNIGGGSGFIVRENGVIVTNKHVISEPRAEYTVIMEDGRKLPAEILTRDPINDVAILKINAKALPTVDLGDATRLELGESVIAIGNALGLFKNTVSLGIVSGLSRSISAQADPSAPPQEMRGLIQTDAAINPGNSGGPLVNIQGLAVGINAAIVFGAQNIGFAIPINYVKRDLEDLEKYGRIKRPLLGVRYVIIDENSQAKMNLPVGYGALVTKETPHDHAVIPGSPADKAGLEDKDIILEINGGKITRDHPIQDVLEDLSVGDTMAVTFLRNGKKLKTDVTLTERK